MIRQPKIPEIKPGDPIRASYLNSIANRVNRITGGQVGAFVCGEFEVVRSLFGAGAAGGTANLALGRVTAADIPGATGDGDERVPDTSGSGVIIYSEGDVSGNNWENWSKSPIVVDSIVVIAVIDGHNIIVTDFC